MKLILTTLCLFICLPTCHPLTLNELKDLLKSETPADRESLRQLLIDGDFSELLETMNSLGLGIGSHDIVDYFEKEPMEEVEDLLLALDAEDNVVSPDTEFDSTAEYPGKHGRMNPESAGFVPKRGNRVATSSSKPIDMPMSLDPCVMTPLEVHVAPLEEDCLGCPEFEVQDVEGACGFEMRTYKSGFWATTHLDLTVNSERARAEAAGRLMSYVPGDTAEGALTFRVAYQLTENGVAAAATMLLYLSPQPHPTPYSAGVQAIVLPAHRLYVRGYTGGNYRAALQILAAVLQRQGVGEQGYVPSNPLVIDYDTDFGSKSGKRHEVAFQAITKVE